jgi:hypothetical protein
MTTDKNQQQPQSPEDENETQDDVTFCSKEHESANPEVVEVGREIMRRRRKLFKVLAE